MHNMEQTNLGKNYQHMMEFLINVHILKYIYVLEVPL